LQMIKQFMAQVKQPKVVDFYLQRTYNDPKLSELIISL
jgi:hypothetical protein